MSQPPRPGSRHRPRAWAAPLLLLPLLAGCSGSPFGEALSRSFPGPNGEASGSSPDGAALTPGGASASDTARPANPAAPGSAGSAAGTAGNRPGTSPGGAAQSAAPQSTAATPATPGAKVPPSVTPAPTPRAAAATAPAAGRPASGSAPYRVTIRLPQGDPSAPAEVVTQALRAAGVPFEVETIERIGAAAAAGAAAPTAGSGGVPLGAPVVRPAPPPR